MKTEFKPLAIESEHKETVLSVSSSLFKVKEFMDVMVQAFQNKGMAELLDKLSKLGRGTIWINESWFDRGVNCVILQPGKSWRTGKVRIKVTLDFCSDEPELEEALISNNSESSLDDIRRIITNDN